MLLDFDHKVKKSSLEFYLSEMLYEISGMFIKDIQRSCRVILNFQLLFSLYSEEKSVRN